MAKKAAAARAANEQIDLPQGKDTQVDEPAIAPTPIPRTSEVADREEPAEDTKRRYADKAVWGEHEGNPADMINEQREIDQKAADDEAGKE